MQHLHLLPPIPVLSSTSLADYPWSQGHPRSSLRTTSVPRPRKTREPPNPALQPSLLPLQAKLWDHLLRYNFRPHLWLSWGKSIGPVLDVLLLLYHLSYHSALTFNLHRHHPHPSARSRLCHYLFNVTYRRLCDARRQGQQGRSITRRLTSPGSVKTATYLASTRPTRTLISPAVPIGSRRHSRTRLAYLVSSRLSHRTTTIATSTANVISVGSPRRNKNLSS